MLGFIKWLLSKLKRRDEKKEEIVENKLEILEKTIERCLSEKKRYSNENS